MRVGVLSDIHSNPFALSAVLADAGAAGVDELWLAGDTFGYYPWAAETFELVAGRFAAAVLGNHDKLVADGPLTQSNGIVASIAAQNAAELSAHTPDALCWLHGLPSVSGFMREGWWITIAHGTPDDPLDGRFYPDDNTRYGWLPAPGEVLVLGQTHRPILRGSAGQGLLVNPGSVGQPRDGSPMPSWALLDLSSGAGELRRASYDHRAAIDHLLARGWDAGISSALDRPV
jgi:predicted phosphodiesterase